MVDYRGERRGLAGAGRADDQWEAPFVHDDFLEGLRQSELFECGIFGSDRPNNHSNLLLLDKDVYAEAAKSGNGDREIALEVLREFLALPLVHRRVRSEPPRAVIAASSLCI
jgi:hypothetical protein